MLVRHGGDRRSPGRALPTQLVEDSPLLSSRSAGGGDGGGFREPRTKRQPSKWQRTGARSRSTRCLGGCCRRAGRWASRLGSARRLSAPSVCNAARAAWCTSALRTLAALLRPGLRAAQYIGKNTSARALSLRDTGILRAWAQPGRGPWLRGGRRRPGK